MTAGRTGEPSRRRAVRHDAQTNRDRILTVAADLMGRRGRNIPIADIAEAAGVGVGTLYRGYRDRTALLHALEHRSYGLLIAALDRIGESGRTGAPAVQAYLEECLQLGDQLVLPLRGAPPLTDPTSIDARLRINHAIERFLADGHAQGTVRADVNATDVIACGAMITQPLPHGPVSASIARRHVALFVHGLHATDARELPAPPITREDVEAAFTANADADD